MERHERPDELHEAPILGGLSKHDPFVVPDGFFDRFPGIVQQRIAADTGSTRAGFFERFALRPGAIVASFAAVLLAVIVWTAWPEPIPLAERTTEITIEPEEIMTGTIDTDLLYATLGEEGSHTSAVGLPPADDVLLHYLENEDLPLDLLIEDL